MFTQKCIHKESCEFKDENECIDNLFGCIKANMTNTEEAENP